MSLKYGLLGLLENQNMSGYDLNKVFETSIGFFWKSSISQVYRELDSMEKSGWIVSKLVIQENKPNKKIYEILDEGKDKLNIWLSDYDASNDLEFRIGILIRTFFSKLRPENELIDLLNKYSKACQKSLNDLESVVLEGCVDEYDFINRNATLSYGKKYNKMLIEWCEETIELIEKSKL